MQPSSRRIRRIVAIALTAMLSACGNRHRDRAVSLYAAAAAAYDEGRHEAARAGAERSLELDSSFLPALVLAGKAAYFADDGPASILALRRGVRVSPRAGEAALWLARAYRAAGRTGDAWRTCESLLSSDPSSVPALRLASSLALDEGRAAEAYAYLDMAIASAAEGGLAFADRAALRWAKGDREGSLADLDAAIAVLPRGSASRIAATSLRASIEER